VRRPGCGGCFLIKEIAGQNIELNPHHHTKIDAAENQHNTARDGDHFQLCPELYFVLCFRFLSEDVGDGVSVKLVTNDLSQ